MQVRLCLETFFSQCCRPFGLLVAAAGHNRARQRDRLAALLEEFSAVQVSRDNILSSLSNG